MSNAKPEESKEESASSGISLIKGLSLSEKVGKAVKMKFEQEVVGLQDISEDEFIMNQSSMEDIFEYVVDHNDIELEFDQANPFDISIDSELEIVNLFKSNANENCCQSPQKQLTQMFNASIG